MFRRGLGFYKKRFSATVNLHIGEVPAKKMSNREDKYKILCFRISGIFLSPLRLNLLTKGGREGSGKWVLDQQHFPVTIATKLTYKRRLVGSATKFAYKRRSGGKWELGSPAKGAGF
jgi:hypothetical protein